MYDFKVKNIYIKKKKTLRFSVINYKKKFTISVTKNHNECYNFEHISRKTTYSKWIIIQKYLQLMNSKKKLYPNNIKAVGCSKNNVRHTHQLIIPRLSPSCYNSALLYFFFARALLYLHFAIFGWCFPKWCETSILLL